MWGKKVPVSPTEAKPALALRAGRSAPDPFAPEEDSPGEQAFCAPRRPHRLFWILGLGLLICTAVGAGWALNTVSGPSSAGGIDHADPAPPPGIAAIAFVDVEPGIARLFPVQPGRVLSVVPEGTQAKKGDVLLQLDNAQAGAALKQAEAAWEDAKFLLKIADKGPDKHAIDLELQQKAIDIARNKKDALFHEVEVKRDQYDKVLLSKHELDAYVSNLKVAESLVAVEEAKLRGLRLRDPKLEVERAKADVQAKKAQFDRAKLALDECDLRAPEDGSVLRVLVHPGEALGPNSKLPAIQFCPTGKRIIRAEVLQEWAGAVHKGQKVYIQDDTRGGAEWTGTVKHVSDWFTQRRNVVLEPFMVNDIRTLECLIEVNPGGPPLRIGQRVRVTIQSAE
jgi:multidrug resistance efflux pump